MLLSNWSIAWRNFGTLIIEWINFHFTCHENIFLSFCHLYKFLVDDIYFCQNKMRKKKEIITENQIIICPYLRFNLGANTKWKNYGKNRMVIIRVLIKCEFEFVTWENWHGKCGIIVVFSQHIKVYGKMVELLLSHS